MKQLLAALGLASSLALASCGGGVSTNTNTPSTGTATISGAVSGSISQVIIPIVSQQSANVQTTVDMSGSSSGVTFSTSISLGAGFSLSTGTYSGSNTTLAEGSVTSGSTTYGMLVGSSAGSSPVGSYTLTITNAGSTLTAQGVTTFLGVHGTFTGTYLLNQQAGGATTTVNVTF